MTSVRFPARRRLAALAGSALLVALRKRAAGDDVEFMRRKIATARFYAEQLLTRVPRVRDSVADGGTAMNALEVGTFRRRSQRTEGAGVDAFGVSTRPVRAARAC